MVHQKQAVLSIELNNKGEMTIQVKEGCFYTEGEYVARV